ncbi:unnamed protein product [Laminaria digitata]
MQSFVTFYMLPLGSSTSRAASSVLRCFFDLRWTVFDTCCCSAANLEYTTRGIWDRRFTLATIITNNIRRIWVFAASPSHGDNLFGTCRISHPIGVLFVVCGGLMLSSGYLGILFNLSMHY